MAIRRGEQLLQSLRDGRQLFIDGEPVRDVTADPHFAAAARSAWLSFTRCSTTRRSSIG
jgi:aromatic ring hydroxylase